MRRLKALMFFATAIAVLAGSSYACTNLLVTKKASADGSTMVTYAADSHSLYGELYFSAAARYADGVMMDIYEWDTGKYLGQIPQVRETYQTIGNMNEYQLAIAETTYGGRPELEDKKGIMDYGSLIYIALQRAKTAREAIVVMTDLVKKYGYYSSGESFSISDPNEVWILEMIGKGEGNTGAVWVALRIPDGYISAHANHARITTFNPKDKENCMAADDVISFAKEKGYFPKDGKDADFSFSDTYAPLDFGGLRFCEGRVWSIFRRVNKDMDKYITYVKGETKERMPLWVKPDKLLTIHDAMELMRDHFEGTEFDMTTDVGAGPYKCPYRWRPMTWKVDGQEYLHERAISTQQTGFSFVSQSRATLPNAVGGVLWFGVDDTYSTVYVPMYCGNREVPYNFAVGNGSFNEFSWESAFWVFNFVSNYTYSRYSDMIKDVQKVQRELEGNFLMMQTDIEKEALALYATSPERARAYLTEYSKKQAATTVERWKKLGETLIFKYLDGNPKDEYNRPTHPANSDDWYRKIVKETGDSKKVKTIEQPK